MASRSSDSVHISEGILLSITNNKNKDKTICYDNEDENCEPESGQCHHQLSYNSVRPLISSEEQFTDLELHDTKLLLDDCRGNDYQQKVNNALNHPFISLNASGSSHEPQVNKHFKNKADRYNVKYSVNESKPLISEDCLESDTEYEKALLILPHHLQREQPHQHAHLQREQPHQHAHLQREQPHQHAHSLDNISSLNTLCNDKRDACTESNMAASSTLSTVNNSEEIVSLSKEELNNRYMPIICDVEPEPDLNLGQLNGSPKCSQGYSEHHNLPSSHIQPYSTEISSQQQLTESHHNQLCSIDTGSSRTSFTKNNEDIMSASLGAASRATQGTHPHSPAHQDAHEIFNTPNSSYQLDTEMDISPPINMCHQNDVRVTGYTTPTSVSTLRQPSLSSEDKGPLRECLPLGQDAPELNQSYLVEFVKISDTPCYHKSCINNSLHSSHHGPYSNSTHQVIGYPSHDHVSSVSLSLEEPTFQNKIFENSHDSSNEEGSCVPPTSSQPTTATPHKNNSYSVLNSPTTNPFYRCDNNIADSPQLMLYQGIQSDLVSSERQPDSNNHSYFTENSHNSAADPAWEGRIMTTLKNSEQLQNLHLKPKNEAANSESSKFGHCAWDDSSNRFHIDSSEQSETHHNEGVSLDSVSSRRNDQVPSPHPRTSSVSQHIFHSNNCHALSCISPKSLDPDIPSATTTSNKITAHHVGKLQTDHIVQLRLCNEQAPMKVTINNTNNTINFGQKDNGIKTETIQSDRTSYCDSNFLVAREMFQTSMRNTETRSSLPSSIDSEHPVNREGSLQRSNTSELGLLKGDSKTFRNTGYSDRETPDYSYLCIVATILNPLFGLAAFLCNHYARRNFRLQNRVQANNLYFATITLSTIAIFLSLVGATLLITHSVVVRSDKKLSDVTTATEEDCESRLFGYDDSMKRFFNMDFELYCGVTKNERVMQALKRFWLEDLQNKKKHVQVEPKCEGGNCSDSGNPIVENATNNDINGVNETPLNIKDTYASLDSEGKASGLTGNDIGVSGVPQHLKPFNEDQSSHNTVLSSKDGPVVPPGLVLEYKKYLKDIKQPQFGDINPPEHTHVSFEDLPVEPHEDLPVEPHEDLPVEPHEESLSNNLITDTTSINTINSVFNISTSEATEPVIDSAAPINQNRNNTANKDNN